MKTLLMTIAMAAALASSAASVDLVSAKGVDATAWVELSAPADGAFAVTVTPPKGFSAVLLREVPELRDPNAFYTDVPGLGRKALVGVGLEEAARGRAAKAGERVRFRLVVPVAATAPAGLHKGRLTLSSGTVRTETDLLLRVLDFELPPAKSRYAKKPWLSKCEGGVPSDWTPEGPDTYLKQADRVTNIAASMASCRSDLAAERWHAFGVGYYGVLDLPYVLNPDSWRRSAGVWAWQMGFDGVVFPAGKTLDPVVRAGLEDAAIDVRYLSFCLELSDLLADRSKRAAEIVYEGRLGQFWLDRISADDDDMDVMRLEAQARIVRLLAFTRKEVAR